MFDLIICGIDYTHCIECILGVYHIAFVVFCSCLFECTWKKEMFV